MQFEKGSKTSTIAGYVLAYCVFTTVLYFIITFVRGSSVSPFVVAGITLAVAIAGAELNRWFN
ncbi:MAG: hypothetical protein ABH879_07405 [archaeon]